MPCKHLAARIIFERNNKCESASMMRLRGYRLMTREMKHLCQTVRELDEDDEETDQPASETMNGTNRLMMEETGCCEEILSSRRTTNALLVTPGIPGIAAGVKTIDGRVLLTRCTEWTPDNFAVLCHDCTVPFDIFVRKHHCRACGELFCSDCSSTKPRSVEAATTKESSKREQRVCNCCSNKLEAARR